ncbi:hypothetical protein [Streptomyces sp.]|uniref:hypothetical protein n=1 Tax=Streptomyces sp. TaxID=1931 RepID=UPI003D6BD4C7
MAVLAASLLAAGSVPSWAVEMEAGGTSATSSSTSGRATFHHYGDKIEVCDTETDGINVYGVYRYYKTSASYIEGRHDQTRGSGSCDTWDHDFIEGSTVLIRECDNLPYFPDGCLPWKNGVA